ncbi:MAG TPA: C45 family peptidase, partial [Nitrososphaerales archaeon]|nr:C45 family peptidase [Nitrososphaerales archaeon]
MYHGSVQGTYSEMGKSRGGSLYDVGFRLPGQDEASVKFGLECEAEISRVFPRIREEFLGFADGCHARYEDVLAFMAAIGVRPPSPACSLFAAAGSQGTVFGRNYDFYYKFADYTEHFVLSPHGAFRSAGDSDVFIGREDGVNEAGLAVGISSVGSKTVGPGLNFPLVVRHLLDDCRDVEAAVESALSIRFSTTNNYLLADSSGAIAVVEASPERVEVRRPQRNSGFLVATNHFVHPDMIQMEDLTRRDSDSVQRFEAIARGVASTEGGISAERAEAILSDHRGRVCSHHEDIKLGTLWSMVANLTERKLFLAEGHPCDSKYSE